MENDDLRVEDLPDDLTSLITRTTVDHTSGGAYGDVWKCHYNADGISALVAVKAFRFSVTDDLGAINRNISREIGILKILRHNNIVPLWGIATGFGRMPELRCLVSPWMPNGTLTAYLTSNHDDLTVLDRSRMLEDISAGLRYLHSESVMHGDITGANILIDKSGHARLIDFGLSTIIQPLIDRSHLAISSVRHGAIRYAAPELVLSDGTREFPVPLEKTDIYSFGCIMLEVLSGRLPWSEHRREALIIITMSQGRGPQRPDGHPAIIDLDWNFIQKCLQFASELRPSAEEVLAFVMHRFSYPGSPGPDDDPGEDGEDAPPRAPLHGSSDKLDSDATEQPSNRLPRSSPQPSISEPRIQQSHSGSSEAKDMAATQAVRSLDRDLQMMQTEQQAQFNLPRSSNIIDDNLAPGATSTHETRPVVFDADPFAIPFTSIRKLSEYPTSSGGLGDTWKCSMVTDPLIPTEVAVKTIRIADIRNGESVQKAKKILRREVAVWIRLKHAHVLTLHGTVSGFGQLPALVSKWMHNGALEGYLGRTSLTMEQKLKLVKQVVDGLKYLHDEKVIHGDLTSTNVLIDRDGNAFLADFGLSVVLAKGDKSYYSSHSSGAVRWSAPELIGSPEPESILDDDDSDFDFPKPNSQSDVFSLGCIMLHVFSGRPPFWWLNNVQQLFHAQFKRVEPYRLEPGSVTVSHQHLDFMRKCWSKPEVRPSTGDAASFVEDELARVPSLLSD